MLWAAISIVIILIDQYTKQLIIRSLANESSIEVIKDFFYIIHRENSGAAWSILQNGRYFFIVLTPIVVGIIIYYMIKIDSKLLRFILSVIIGGTVGNFIDRLLKGKVVDFLDFHFGSYVFPTFNVADIALVAGTILLAVYMLFIYKNPEDKGKKDEMR